jgi:hypothetical protein
MKYLIIIIIGVVGWIGFETHKRNEVEVQQTISEQLINNGYNVKVKGINLPLTFTFLSSKVESEVFFEKGDRVGSIKVEVTPIGSYPILQIFDNLNYQTSISSMESIKLSLFK